jgi:hypothetical protein
VGSECRHGRSCHPFVQVLVGSGLSSPGMQ